MTNWLVVSDRVTAGMKILWGSNLGSVKMKNV